jgi:cell wall-associated NlpC family hydrolase
MVAASTSGLLASHAASADQVGDLKAKAASLASRINALGLQEEALSEQYDAAQLRAASIQAQVASAAQQVAAAEASANKARTALKQDAVLAYVHGGNSPYASGGALSSANDSLLRAEYVNSLAANQSDAIDQFRVAALQEQAAKAQLQQQQSAAQAQLAQVNQDRQAAAALASQLQATQSQVNGQIATLIAQQEAAARAAAAQAAAARLAAEQAARARTVSAPNATLLASNPPPVGHGASGAVAAAESRVGDWYQWGAAGPNTFDCSGLTMWAYAQVGVSLPHYSGGQYADTTHIPMSDLQPGDLVFPSDPGEHVAMYVGNGEIVEAPYTGAQVHIVPMGSWFVLASRVEG